MIKSACRSRLSIRHWNSFEGLRLQKSKVCRSRLSIRHWNVSCSPWMNDLRSRSRLSIRHWNTSVSVLVNGIQSRSRLSIRHWNSSRPSFPMYVLVGRSRLSIRHWNKNKRRLPPTWYFMSFPSVYKTLKRLKYRWGTDGEGSFPSVYKTLKSHLGYHSQTWVSTKCLNEGLIYRSFYELLREFENYYFGTVFKIFPGYAIFILSRIFHISSDPGLRTISPSCDFTEIAFEFERAWDILKNSSHRSPGSWKALITGWWLPEYRMQYHKSRRYHIFEHRIRGYTIYSQED